MLITDYYVVPPRWTRVRGLGKGGGVLVSPMIVPKLEFV